MVNISDILANDFQAKRAEILNVIGNVNKVVESMGKKLSAKNACDLIFVMLLPLVTFVVNFARERFYELTNRICVLSNDLVMEFFLLELHLNVI